jgi:hypothetical protein
MPINVLPTSTSATNRHQMTAIRRQDGAITATIRPVVLDNVLRHHERSLWWR